MSASTLNAQSKPETTEFAFPLLASRSEEEFLNRPLSLAGRSMTEFLNRATNYMTNRMRRAWHPDAKSYVYAFAFHNLKMETEEFQKEVWANAPPRTIVEINGGLVKVGMSDDPKRVFRPCPGKLPSMVRRLTRSSC